MSERITWTTCPHCAGAAAIGWLHDMPVEFDCTAGCRVTHAQLRQWRNRVASTPVVRRRPLAGEQ